MTSTTALPAGVPEMLRAAHDVFVSLTTDRIMRIETLAQSVHKRDDAPAALAEIAQIAHKISGVAGTLGYPDIGDTARWIEQQIKTDLAADAPLRNWDETAKVIDTLLDAMEALE